MNLTKTENNFNHELFGNLTTITNDNNEVFFIVKEVSDILEFSDAAQLSRRLDQDDIIKLNHAESKLILKQDGIHSSGIQLLTESGLYSAILGSRKQEAKLFKKWVTSEILPSIRKTGIYMKKPTNLEILRMALAAEEKYLEEEAKRKRLEVELDKSNEWFTIKKVAYFNNVSWKDLEYNKLKAASEALHLYPKKVFDANFPKGVNSYNYKAWKMIYPDFNYNFTERKVLN